MRIRIEDEFDSELEEEYKAVDKDLVIGNGVLSNENIPVIEVNEINITSHKDCIENNMMNISKEGVNNYNLNNGFSIEIQGATLIDTDEANKENKNRLDKNNRIKENYKTKDSNENVKSKVKEKKESIDVKKIKGKITVYAKLDDVKGECISDAKINLYALNGLSPKLISSRVTDKNGIVIFDNLEEGSYRVIEIVNRKYFEKPTYVQWNEVTINKNLYEEEVIVVNKIRRY